MKAFVVERYGDADTVRAGDLPDPQVGAHDVLVRIHAASVNPVDLKIRDGGLKTILPLRAPFVLGNDLAGPAGTAGTVGAGPEPDGHVRRTHRNPPGRRGAQTSHAHHGRRPPLSRWSD